MVLKWLLEKLKKSDVARLSISSWTLSSTAFRLLAPERLATLLASADILSIFQDSAKECKLSGGLLVAVTDCLNLLLELSNGPRGASLKATLSADAAIAAEFAGAWLTAVDQANFDVSDKVSAVANHSLLNPAIQLWALRKRRADDNELFADSCLASAAYVLESLSLQPGVSSGKRKRKDADGNTGTGHVRALESLIAKHVFLPARTVFSKEQQRNGVSSASVEAPSDGPPSDLQRRLAQYKAARPASGDFLDSRVWRYYPSVTALLDIALRCLIASTPNQRLKERPWVESVFASLLDCAVAFRLENASPVQSMLVDMLPVVRKHAFSLSRAMLTELVGKHGGRNIGVSELMNWKLVAEVVRMDANVYTDRAVAERLFNDISSAHLALGRKGKPHEPVNLDHSVSLFSLWKYDIVAKVVQAFAQNRDLLTFIALWHEQLHENFRASSRCVWLELDRALVPLLENHLTERQIIDCVARYQTSIKLAQADGPRTKDVRTARVESCASVVVVCGLLCGIHTSGLIDNLQGELSALFEVLLELFEQNAATTAEYPQIWALFTRVFELWFPTWAAGQASRESLVKRADEILSSTAVQQAETFAAAVRVDKESNMAAANAACEADGLLTVLSNALHHYDTTGRALKVVDRIVRHIPATDLQHILNVPAVLVNLGEDGIRNDVLFDWLGDSSGRTEKDLNDSTIIDSVRAVIATAVANSQTAVVEDIVRVALAFLEPGDMIDEPLDVANVLNGLQVLADVPATALSTQQRKRILDGAVALEEPQISGLEILQRRLLLMVRMLELPCPEAVVCTDPTALWRLGKPGKEHNGALAGTVEATSIHHEKTVELLDQLAELVIKHLVARQGQDASQRMLFGLASEAKQQIDVMCRSGSTFSGNRRMFSILKVVLSHFDTGLRPELKERCLEPATLGTYAKFLLRTAKKSHPQDHQGSASEGHHLPNVLDALLVMPEAVKTAGNTIDFRAKLTALVSDILDARLTNLLDTRNVAAQIERVTLVRCVELTCRWGLAVGDEVVPDVARRLLDAGLQPREHAALLTAFHHGCTRNYAQAGSMPWLLELLLPSGTTASASQLTLLQVAISTLNREQLDKPSEMALSTPQEIVHRLLRLVKETPELTVRRRACVCIATVLREKPFMTNQYMLETTVSTLHAIVLAAGDAGGMVFLDACRVFTILLQQYRSRLKDRMNLVVPLLDALVSRLFGNAKGLKEQRGGLSSRHARVLARILQLLCNPPQTRSRPKTSDLVDDARKAQAHVGQYMQFVLHHYCKQVLEGTLIEGVSDAIRPGLWAMIEAMQVNDTNARWVLSAAMSSGEREQLSRVYHDYETFGKGKSG
ncbi:hypothetical protein LTR85_010812 [Meristemomyces frigidus]|nr:hypothetical protein LTR85_010812 [Meristemomyces frigidus]